MTKTRLEGGKEKDKDGRREKKMQGVVVCHRGSRGRASGRGRFAVSRKRESKQGQWSGKLRCLDAPVYIVIQRSPNGRAIENSYLHYSIYIYNPIYPAVYTLINFCSTPFFFSTSHIILAAAPHRRQHTHTKSVTNDVRKSF